ncbi:type II toxin-antitoxin system RelE/ParE family toxin [Longimicrobium sp.]|uniref:type II toxin-antitoxin system RelE/ParE family toxin n=1 Tax=Longimicrobium sp. TaxID=2029185 RepID=UPI002F91F413
MSFEVEYTDEFGGWWDSLSEREQDSVARSVQLLEAAGPHLPFPHSSSVRGSRYSHMRELRVQHEGRPYRVLYAFDPRRVAILLIGGDKTGDGRWYQRFIPVAEVLYDAHLEEVADELEGLKPSAREGAPWPRSFVT